MSMYLFYRAPNMDPPDDDDGGRDELPNGWPDTIANLHDLSEWIGEEQPRLFNRRLFKDTECGASISLYFDWRDPLHNGAPGWETMSLDTRGVVGFTVQTIVEGSDAEVTSDLFTFPVAVVDVERFVAQMEAEADALWHDANDDDS